ncbi:hypothetical protein AJ80_07067 [Polytolypa hystricis UAMH7299]|uniref:2'-phosphotransferase n=1 Tax=Polytolypa hystricis (strain UAMH7299) TaxID=1447883 RepID=A0A2B7XSY5_POLH7|nr:hypothetical protein AJ80_07067 [Polytolypa hystricis UAMH7299]
MAPGQRGRRREESRPVAVSKAMSYILRHAAEREGLKMDNQGYASVADLLEWKKLKSQKVTFEEVLDAVATSDKKRFGLLYKPPTETEVAPEPSTPPLADETSRTDTSTAPPSAESATQQALAANDPDPSHYLIRATQGHSMKTVEAESLLQKLSLADSPLPLPSTVVHGTYHAAWPRILASGGLKCMSRNHIHFASGPAESEILPDGRDGRVIKAKPPQGKDKKAKGDSGVISGMRADAQILIYIDIKRAMEAGCPFWMSENGVILSEGMEMDGGAGEEKIVGLEFFDFVVERKNGMGVLWDQGVLVQETPEWMFKAAHPKGKMAEGDGYRKGGKGRGGRKGKDAPPPLRIEKDTDVVVNDP